jgi:hypothetical protein
VICTRAELSQAHHGEATCRAVIAVRRILGDISRMTGRLIQLGRQLRKLRHIVGGSPTAATATTLRRATQLARELAREHAAVEDVAAAFHDLAVRGILEPAFAERLATALATGATSQPDDALDERVVPLGRDLDTLLRSLELGAPAPELPFEAIGAREPVEGSAKPDSTAGVPISGRVLELAVRDGLAVISVDDQPIPITAPSGESVTSFALAAAPTGTPEIQSEPTGVRRVVWEHLAIELAPDFKRALVSRS